MVFVIVYVWCSVFVFVYLWCSVFVFVYLWCSAFIKFFVLVGRLVAGLPHYRSSVCRRVSDKAAFLPLAVETPVCCPLNSQFTCKYCGNKCGSRQQHKASHGVAAWREKLWMASLRQSCFPPPGGCELCVGETYDRTLPRRSSPRRTFVDQCTSDLRAETHTHQQTERPTNKQKHLQPKTHFCGSLLSLWQTVNRKTNQQKIKQTKNTWLDIATTTQDAPL